MPNFLEKRLRAHVPAGVDANRYVYGTMNNLGAMRGNKITAKGREMEKKHEEDKHMKKAPAGHMREMRIEFHRAGKKITGMTVHHHMMPTKASKSGAFMEETHHSFPFGADQHEEMMDHVAQHLGGKSESARDAEEQGEKSDKADEREE